MSLVFSWSEVGMLASLLDPDFDPGRAFGLDAPMSGSTVSWRARSTTSGLQVVFERGEDDGWVRKVTINGRALDSATESRLHDMFVSVQDKLPVSAGSR